MFSFFHTIFTKVASAITSVVIAIGLVSAPLPLEQNALVSFQPQHEEAMQPIDPVNLTVDTISAENVNARANDDVKKEIEVLRARILKEQKKREILENKLNSPMPPKENIQPVQIVSPKPVTFTTPSGAVLDQSGNVIKLPENSALLVENVITKELTIVEISKLISPAIVLIETSYGKGSGIIIENNGLILTAAHVVQGISNADIFLSDESRHIGTVIGRDEFNDIALIKISEVGLQTATLGDSDSVNLGDQILVYGYPLQFRGVVLSVGILNGAQPSSSFVYLQTDAKTQAGNSGGAWVNKTGKIVGVHVAGLGPQIQGIKINEGFNFAVPINFVKQKISLLKSGLQAIDYSSQKPPVLGSTIDIPRSVVASIGFNSDLGCDQLASVPPKYFLTCQLYKSAKSQYKWNIVEGE